MDSNLSFLKEGRVYNIDLGATFQKSTDTAFHTVRYDFKPASVDLTQQGEVSVGETNEVGETNVSITLPHQQGSKNASTVYKGSKKPALKECVLIFDKETGTFTLERITSQIQVKKTRTSGNIGSQPPVIPSSAPKMNKKALKKTAVSKSQKPQTTENRKLDYEEKAEPVQPTKPPINLLVEEEPAAKRLNLSASSSSGESSSDSSSSEDESSSSGESSTKSPPEPATRTSLFEDLELSDSDSD